ncbi:MAG: class I SAM-dependent methyltransferase [Planctomycetes bacterium]|nr:class I SAM-dependent methyltransferase [Planctomycetota bacterium]
MSSARGFDRLARCYRTLELAAFGRDLERTRWSLLDRLVDCRTILVLGEGDGRCLERLLAIAPEARIDCVDFSSAMLARAARRLSPRARERVRFLQRDVLADELPPGPYCAVVTMFFLDCFTDAELAILAPRIRARLLPAASWLWADFALPERGFARLRARCWLALLYAFFRRCTALSARALPAAEAQIERAGFVRIAEDVRRGGLLRCALFRAGEVTDSGCGTARRVQPAP